MSTDATTDQSQYGAGVAVPCNCGRGDDDIVGHSVACDGSLAVAQAIISAGCRGVISGAMTAAEERLVQGVAYIVKARIHPMCGPDGDVNRDALGRLLIKRGFAEIFGPEVDD